MTNKTNVNNNDNDVVAQQTSFSNVAGRAVGVISAVAAAGLDISSNGVRVSNLAGLLVGSACGYAIGDLADTYSKATNKANTPMIALAGAVGFSTAVGTIASSRVLDPSEKHTEEFNYELF